MNTRTQVLKIFKQLHRTRQQVFKEDQTALIAARLKINEEFRKFKDTNEIKQINYLIKSASEAEEYLRTSVIQAAESTPGVYKAEITKDTKLLNNTPYKYSAEETMRKTEKELPRQRRKRNNKNNIDNNCGCQEQQQ